MKLVVAFIVGAGLAQAQGTPPAAAPSPADGKEAAPQPRVEAEPPPSAYDRARAEKGEAPETESMGGQLIRTVLALAGVVGLIYLLFKIGLGRLLQGGAIRPGRTVKVLERVPVDARHALVVVELPSGERLLLGSSEHGMSVLTRLESTAPAAPSSFQQVLDKSRGDSSETS